MREARVAPFAGVGRCVRDGHLQRQFGEARQTPVGIGSADGRDGIDAIQRLALAGVSIRRPVDRISPRRIAMENPVDSTPGKSLVQPMPFAIMRIGSNEKESRFN
ncbi:hypothetical protein QF001_003394 [Paraburkholderia youngii]|uniref:hypothetical protein n=1 Tax=Paraburkholderia youngii TaxID=2782701 RepID=UPI003D25CCC4